MTGTVTRPTTDGNIERFILNKPGTFASTSIECFSFAHQNLPLCSSARRKERIPWDPAVSSAFRRIRHADGRIRLPLSSVGGGGGDGQSGSDGQVIMGGVLGSRECRVFSAPTNTSHSDLDLRGQVPSLLLWGATSWAGRKDRKWSASASSSTTGRHTEGLSLLFKLLLVDDN